MYKGSLMGDMADDYMHNEIMAQIKAEDYSSGTYFFTAPKRPKNIYWIANGGNKINIKNMTTNHIINSINKCKRDNWRLEAIPYLEAELDRRCIKDNK